MPTLKLGLAPGKSGYFDPLTNLYLSLDKPIDTITYTDAKQLEKITHALLSTVPALVKYEGELPQESIDAWKAKYDKIFRAPTFKNIVENGKVIGQVPVKDVVNSSIGDDGRAIEGNRAFDRTDKVEAAAEPVAAVSAGEAEQVELFAAEAPAEVEEAKEAPKKKATRSKKQD